MSVSFVAGAPSEAGTLMWDTVGNVSSSATNGSSMARVAGKKHLPISPCAAAGPALASTTSAATNDTRQLWIRMATLCRHSAEDTAGVRWSTRGGGGLTRRVA